MVYVTKCSKNAECKTAFFCKALTVSSSCLAVVCAVTLNTVKGSGPGAPYTVTLCCCDTCFSSELNSCVWSEINTKHVVIRNYHSTWSNSVNFIYPLGTEFVKSVCSVDAKHKHSTAQHNTPPTHFFMHHAFE